MEFGECSSGSNSSSNEVWAKLVPSDSRYSDVEIRSNEMVICSEITSSSLEKHDWCKITRNSDQSSAMMQNKSSNTILVDEATVQNEDDVVINCGSEIIPGPARQGYLSYRFKLMPRESFTRWLKVCIDAEHAKCSICLNVWHDVVTVAPCLHNFCNGCFSEWLRRSQERHASVLCPQCRAVVQFAGRNHFLRNIEEVIYLKFHSIPWRTCDISVQAIYVPDVLQADSSLKRSDEEITLLDSYASIKSNLFLVVISNCWDIICMSLVCISSVPMVIQTGKKHRRKRPHPILDAENEVADFPCPQCGNSFNFFYNYLLINHIIFWNTGTFGRKTVRSILKEEKYEPISGAQLMGFIFYNGVPYTQLLKLGSSDNLCWVPSKCIYFTYLLREFRLSLSIGSIMCLIVQLYQPGTEFSGFHCNRNTIHLQCQACGGMMPSRIDIGVPQHCLGCDRVFCGAYWHAQGVSRSDSHSICNHDNFEPISERAVSRIPFLAHEKNRHEQDITERCIGQTGKTLQDVISDWIGKLSNREIDRTRMPLNHAEMITVGTHVCNSFRQKQLTGKIAGMAMPAGHSTITKTMRVKEIMCVVLLGVIMHNKQRDNLFMRLYGMADIV
ncbi:hypothetical protein DKX38_006153 [Salix brachista]|uniref:RING-type domain-containing protein n=1 Tax=Salix brachista TaxID=2182728 RepID=A0A5N5N4L5_9ROSI|nr:hypothetical protein DKX38_006153 [Salix brachista]